MWLSTQRRANLPIPRWVNWAAVVWVLGGVAAIGSYNHQIKNFWDEIRDDWRANERRLADDPRNGLTKEPGAI
jgi:hypothetical protein